MRDSVGFPPFAPLPPAPARMYDQPPHPLPAKSFFRAPDGGYVWPELPSPQAAHAAGQRVSVFSLGPDEPVVRMISHLAPVWNIMHVVVQAWLCDDNNVPALSTLEVVSFNALFPQNKPYAQTNPGAGRFCRALPPRDEDDAAEGTSRPELTEVHHWLQRTQEARLLHALEFHFDLARFNRCCYTA